MTDANFLLIGFVGFGLFIAGFIGYKYQTEMIIKELERDKALLTTENKRLKRDLNYKSAELLKYRSIQPVKMQAIEMVDRDFYEILKERDKQELNKYVSKSLFNKFIPALEKIITVERDQSLDTTRAAAYRANLTLWVDTSKTSQEQKEY